MSIRVLVTASELDEIRPRLDALGPGFEIEYRPGLDRASTDAIDDRDLEVVVGRFAPPDPARTPRLRWLQLDSAGVDHVLADAPWERELTVTNARGVFATAVGQYVLTEILRIHELVDERRELQQRHEWATGELRDRLTGRLVRGMTVLVVGYGGIGREVGRLTDALGMRVLAVKREPQERTDRSYRVPGTGDPDGLVPAAIVGPERLSEVVPSADVIVLTMPLTASTRGLFDAGLIAAMRPDAWLINTGRGSLVDESALARALAARAIGGAVLDVFSTEPLPAKSPFWDTPNTVVTPHVSGGDASSAAIFADLVAQNLARYAAGDALINVVDPVREY
jgi:phosphoglycerate dehydrogenase-like enzyme